MLKEATRLGAPDAAGSNCTMMWQEELTPRLGGQLFVSIKSAEFKPVIEIPAIPSGTFPVFEIVTGCAALAVPAG
jgi:hypothetical protein